MDFFRSVFAGDPDPDPSTAESTGGSEERDSPTEGEETNPDPKPSSDSSGGGAADGGRGGSSGAWSFGGLIKTIAVRSETVIQTYKRDLEEFSTGLKKETAAIREAASRAVKDLPGSLEAGASVAQDSLESVGQAIDDLGGSVWRGTAEIISEVLIVNDASDDPSAVGDGSNQNTSGPSSKRYSRFEAQLLAIQSDLSTFAEEPEDLEEFEKWRKGFELGEKEEEIEMLLYENGAVEGFLEKLVPSVVDQDTFWSRYFYRVQKLKQTEDARANLVKRAISGEDEEDLTWEVEDDDDAGKKEEEAEDSMVKEVKEEVSKEKEEENVETKEVIGTSETLQENILPEEHKVENLEVSHPSSTKEEIPAMLAKVDDVELGVDESISKSGDQNVQETKNDAGDSCKDSDVSVVSSQPSMPEEDDLGWDEIEDLGEHDDKKFVASSVSPNKEDLRKRLSTAEEDEDLSWDIEDDDEPAKL